MSFPRASRLVSKHDFTFVFDKPGKLYSQHVKILYRINTLPHPRLGIIVAKRILRLAVDRNRIRRVIRESFRQYQVDLPAVDVVIMLRSSLKKPDYALFRQELEGIWQQLKGVVAGTKCITN